MKKFLTNLYGDWNKITYGLSKWEMVFISSILISVFAILAILIHLGLKGIIIHAILSAIIFLYSATFDLSDHDDRQKNNFIQYSLLISSVLLTGFVCSFTISLMYLGFNKLFNLINNRKKKIDIDTKEFLRVNQEFDAGKGRVLTYRDGALSCPNCKQVMNDDGEFESECTTRKL